MPKGDMDYDLRVTYRVKIKKWRIDDQNNSHNREWTLKVFDRNLQKWISVGALDRPGEDAYIESIQEI